MKNCPVISFNFLGLPSSYVPSEESGIGKIKSKLSLKVQIPDGKIFESRSKSFDSDSKV
jgi:hypothetical protein